MFDAFNDTARQSVVAAQVEARELGHDYVGVEHLILGLLAGPSEVSSNLSATGLDPIAVRGRVVELVGPRPHLDSGPVVGHRFAEIVAGARVEAVRRRHCTITACHVGLALFAHLDDPSVWRGLDAPWGSDLPMPHPPGSVAATVQRELGEQPAELVVLLEGVLNAAVVSGELEMSLRA